MITATRIIRNAPAPFDDEVVLDYESRLLRRRKLTCASDNGYSDTGTGDLGCGDFLVDLPEVVSLEDGDAFVLSDGRQVVVRAMSEPVMVIRGHLARLAWHIGNRHTPCRIEADRLIVRQDHVLEAMLRRLGAEICHNRMPFCPEGGAYGQGRTVGHDHNAARLQGSGQGSGHGVGRDDLQARDHHQFGDNQPHFA